MVVIPLYDGVQSLGFSGPADVLSGANAVGGDVRYDVVTVSLGGVPIRTSSGLTVLPDRALADVTDADTVILPGADGIPVVGAETTGAIGDLVRGARRVASVCTGAFLLAGTGLLDGRRAVTHWEFAGELARRHPAVEVDARDTVVRDGPVTTAGGVASGIELALALVEEDLGREAAHHMARLLVTYVSKPGGQAQFAAPEGGAARSPALREVQLLIHAHPDEELTLNSLARRAGLSERHFSRLFRAQVGMSAKEYVERARVAAAMRLLTGTVRDVEDIAREAGFGTGATMRNAFLRVLRVSPHECRERFS